MCRWDFLKDFDKLVDLHKHAFFLTVLTEEILANLNQKKNVVIIMMVDLIFPKANISYIMVAYHLLILTLKSE